jgi:hypothetical protein
MKHYSKRDHELHERELPAVPLIAVLPGWTDQNVSDHGVNSLKINRLIS